jgi:hypothetical protein
MDCQAAAYNRQGGASCEPAYIATQLATVMCTPLHLVVPAETDGLIGSVRGLPSLTLAVADHIALRRRTET